MRSTTVAAAAFALLLLASSASAGRQLKDAAGRQLLQLATVELGTAGDFVILSKAGVTNVPGSVITGDIGSSPIAFTAITGFSTVADQSGTFATSAQVTGRMYGSDHISPTPSKMTTAVSDFETAYTDAAGRPNADAARKELLGGNLDAELLTPGVYTWSSSVGITTEINIAGGPDDIFIFQIAGDLIMAANLNVVLAGGAKAKNIFWQVAGEVELGAGAHFKGTILAATSVTFVTGSSLDGRVFSQTAVALQKATITQPSV
jgi:hypothetical protein